MYLRPPSFSSRRAPLRLSIFPFPFLLLACFLNFSALSDLPVEPLSARSRPTHLSHSLLPFTLILDDTLMQRN
jgi:hypothetical protein